MMGARNKECVTKVEKKYVMLALLMQMRSGYEGCGSCLDPLPSPV